MNRTNKLIKIINPKLDIMQKHQLDEFDTKFNIFKEPERWLIGGEEQLIADDIIECNLTTKTEEEKRETIRRKDLKSDKNLRRGINN
jgi:hypothetical protein